jgi:hypothetical protein
MAGVAKAIHVLLAEALQEKAWTLATSAGMTTSEVIRSQRKML